MLPLVLLPPLPVVAISARGWVQPRRWTVQILMALIVLIAAFYVFCGRETEGVVGWLYDSDSLMYPALCRSLMHGEPLSGWIFGGPNYLFPDLAAYFLLNLVVPNFRLSVIIFGLLQALAVLAGFALLEATVLPESRNKPLRLFVFVALLAYLARDGAFLGLRLLYEDGRHTGEIISLLFALWLIFRLLGPKAGPQPASPVAGRRSALAFGLALFLLTLLTTTSDALFLVQFIAPAVAMLVMMRLFALIDGRKLALLIAVLVTGALGGVLIYDRFFMRPYLRTYFRISPDHVSKSVEMIFSLLKESGWTHVPLGLLILLSVAVCVGLLLVHLRRLKLPRPGTDRRLACLASFMVFLSLSNFSVLLLSPAVSDRDALIRYAVPLALLPLLLLSSLTQYVLQAVAVEISRPVLLALVLVLPLILVLTVQKFPDFVRLATYYPPWVADLDHEFHKRSLKCGAAQYWQATPFSLFSKEGVQVVALTSRLEPFLWATHRDWFQRPCQFIITDETKKHVLWNYLRGDRIVSKFGPPDDIFTSGTNTVRVYENGRVQFPEFVLSRSGAEAVFPASWLRGQIGAVAGTDRVAEGCAAGCLTFGPYTQLSPGAYRGRILYDAQTPAGDPSAGKWDLFIRIPERKEELIVKEGQLSPQENTIEFAFEISSPSLVGIRTYFAGIGKLTVHKLVLQRVR
jgi:hypothetical protein